MKRANSVPDETKMSAEGAAALIMSSETPGAVKKPDPARGGRSLFAATMFPMLQRAKEELPMTEIGKKKMEETAVEMPADDIAKRLKRIEARQCDVAQAAVICQVATFILTAAGMGAMVWWVTSVAAPVSTMGARNTPPCPLQFCRHFWTALEESNLKPEDLADTVEIDKGMGCACWGHPVFNNGTGKPMILTISQVGRWKRASGRRRWTRSGPADVAEAPIMCGRDKKLEPRMCWARTTSRSNSSHMECNRIPAHDANPNVCIWLIHQSLRLCTNIMWQAKTEDEEWYTELTEDDTAIDEHWEEWWTRRNDGLPGGEVYVELGGLPNKGENVSDGGE